MYVGCWEQHCQLSPHQTARSEANMLYKAPNPFTYGVKIRSLLGNFYANVDLDYTYDLLLFNGNDIIEGVLYCSSC